jgi:hypothetical protein
LTSTYPSSHIKNVRGFNTPKYELELVLEKNIPEWLPMFGKRVRVFHHGMHTQCNGCFELGHRRWECKNKKINWREYIEVMRKTNQFEDRLFGTWIEEPKAGQNQNQNQKKDEEDLRSLLNNPGSLRRMIAACLSNESGNQESQKDNRRDQNQSKKRGRKGSKEKQDNRGEKKPRNQGRS